MIAIVFLMFVVIISMLITRTAAVVLQITGLSQETARFQARSAFTGAGFTTSESESVVNHPVRRNVIKRLMMLGNLGLVTIASTSIVAVLRADSSESPILLFGAMALGLVILTILSYSTWVDRVLCRLISRVIARYSSLNHGNLANLLQLDADHGVSELRLNRQNGLCNSTLADAGLKEKGITVLGLKPPTGEYIVTPSDETKLSENDNLVLHGPNHAIAGLDRPNS